jgi:hypothetical protein
VGGTIPLRTCACIWPALGRSGTHRQGQQEGDRWHDVRNADQSFNSGKAEFNPLIAAGGNNVYASWADSTNVYFQAVAVCR